MADLTAGALMQRCTLKWREREESELIEKDNLNQIQTQTKML